MFGTVPREATIGQDDSPGRTRARFASKSPQSWGPSHLPRVGSLHTYFTCIMVETEYAASTLVERQGVGPQPDGPSNE